MEQEQILSSLCAYDKRNPDCIFDDEEIEDHNRKVSKACPCYCDNCFYGRAQLAEHILSITEIKAMANY